MADMKPEEIANLAKLYADLNKQAEENRKIMEKATVSLKEKLEAQAKDLELQTAILKIQVDLKKSNIDLALEQQKYTDIITKKDEQLQKEKEIAKDRFEFLNKEIDIFNELIKLSTDDTEKFKLREEIRKLENETKIQQEILDKKLVDVAKTELEQAKLLKTLKKDLKNQTLEDIEVKKKEIDATNDLNKATQSLTVAISDQIYRQSGLNDTYKNQIALAMQNNGVTGVMGMTLKALGSSFSQVLNPVAMFSTVLYNAVQNFQKFYDAMAKVTRELGTTVSSGFNAAAAAGNRMGVEAGAQAATVNALGTAFVNLGNKQREQTTQLLVASYEMQRFGIGANESITILSGFQRSLGLSATQSAELATNLVHTARGLGLTSEAVKGLANNMETFISYGSRANEVMLETLEVSSRFGIGTDAIAKMTAKLDSMEGSINAANTIARELGVALDPLQLLRADPAQKMEMVADAIKRSGFEGENARFQIKVLGESLGLTAAQMQMLTKQTENGANQISGLEKSLRDLDKSFQDFFDGQTLDGLAQLKTLLDSASKPLMLILGFLNTVLGGLIGLLNMGIAKLNEFGTFFGVGLGDALALGGVALLLFMVKIKAMLMGLAASATGALSSIGAGVSGMITTISATAPVAAGAVGPLLAFGAAIFLIGAGIGIAAFGMSKLVMAFKGMGAEAFAALGAMMMLGVGLYFLIPAITGLALSLASLTNPISTTGVLVLIGVGAAVTLIGLGIKMAADGMASLISSVTELAIALGQLKDVDIDGTTTAVIKGIIQPFSDAPADLEVKMKAVAQVPAALEQYAQALQVFSAAGGATAASVMTEKFVESMTTISEKATTTQTASPAVSSGFGEGGVLQIVVRDAVVFESYIDKTIQEYDRKKRTGQ